MSSTFPRTSAIIVTVALALAGNVARPRAQRSGEQSVTAIGCVNRAVNNGSLAGGPGVPPTTPTSAAVLANSNEPTGAFLLNGATPPRSSSEAATHDAATALPSSYVLDGAARDLEPHLGHQVEVNGTLQTVNEGAKDAKTMVRHIRVASIKMIAPACAKPGEPKK